MNTQIYISFFIILTCHTLLSSANTIIDAISNHSIYTIEVVRIDNPIDTGIKKVSGFQLYGKYVDDNSSEEWDDVTLYNHYKLINANLDLDYSHPIRILIQAKKPVIYIITKQYKKIEILKNGNRIQVLDISSEGDTRIQLTIHKKKTISLKIITIDT